MKRKEPALKNTAVKVGIASAVALGAIVSGFLATRQGRRFVKDVWQGRRRSPLEDRALDSLWADRVVGGRRIDVEEIEPGVLALMGSVRTADERRRARAVVARVSGVKEIEDRLELVRKRGRENSKT